MITRKIVTLALLATTIMFTSCTTEDDSPTEPLGDYENGILISHEGNFGQGNATVSFVSNDYATVENGIFSTVNNSLLGDTAQSIAFNDDLAYIVVNVSNKIEIVNRYTFETVSTIDSGLLNPRYIAFANGKGYVTNWGDGTNATDDYLAVIDLATNTLETPIAVAEGPENIVANNDTLYVAHKGGFSQNNIVSVVDVSSSSVSTTITVGDVPSTLQLDDAGNLWVLASGKAAWTGDETAGKLSKINTSDNSVENMDFNTSEHPGNLSVDGNTLYYYMGSEVYSMVNTDTTLPSASEFSGVNFYDMTVKDGFLYGVDAADFTSNGTLKVYNLSTNTETQSIPVGIVPAGIYFN